MALQDDLKNDVQAIFRSPWTTRDGTVVPDTEALRLGNDAVELDATVLYADISESTGLVDSHRPRFAAEVYKAFLHCAARIIRAEGGEITAYDGDRVMAVFLGTTKNSSATRAGLKINWARQEIINPAIVAQYPNLPYVLKHTVGIDTSKLFVARTGIRGANDLVWVGKAANHAAKLCTLPNATPTWITKEVFEPLMDDVKTGAKGEAMWGLRRWEEMNNRSVYCSNWRYRV